MRYLSAWGARWVALDGIAVQYAFEVGQDRREVGLIKEQTKSQNPA